MLPNPNQPAATRKIRTAVRSDISETRLAVLLLLPALLFLSVVVVYPVIRLFITSFQEFSGSSVGQWVGLKNYQQAFQNAEVLQAFKVTGIYTLITVPGAMLVGLLLALAANLPFRLKWPVRLSLLLPWSMSLAFAALIFAWFFNSDYGIVNDLFKRLGMDPPRWLSTPSFAFAATSVAIIWKTSSFVALILLAGLQSIPKELYEAGQVDGATGWTLFSRITLPMLRPALTVALIFRTITAIQTFDVPYIMTGGGPGNLTTTLAMVIERQTLEYGNFGFGAAIAVLLFLLSLLVTAFYFRQLQGDSQ